MVEVCSVRYSRAFLAAKVSRESLSRLLEIRPLRGFYCLAAAAAAMPGVFPLDGRGLGQCPAILGAALSFCPEVIPSD